MKMKLRKKSQGDPHFNNAIKINFLSSLPSHFLFSKYLPGQASIPFIVLFSLSSLFSQFNVASRQEKIKPGFHIFKMRS